jgi:hypothetical protein
VGGTGAPTQEQEMATLEQEHNTTAALASLNAWHEDVAQRLPEHYRRDLFDLIAQASDLLVSFSLGGERMVKDMSKHDLFVRR